MVRQKESIYETNHRRKKKQEKERKSSYKGLKVTVVDGEEQETVKLIKPIFTYCGHRLPAY